MRILVIDVAAGTGGALSVLTDFCASLQDSQSEWHVAVSTPTVRDSKNVRIHRFPWVKRSWLHRLWFERVTVKRLTKAVQPTVIVSLQNTPVRVRGIPQFVYLHQALPFSDYSLKFRTYPRLWLYAVLTSYRIKAGLRSSAHYVVQTKWMAEAVRSTIGGRKGRITTIRPTVPQRAPAARASGGVRQKSFFYPANGAIYKNHSAILEAVEILHESGADDYKVYLTLSLDELSRVWKRAIPENVVLLGRIPRDEVDRWYLDSTLVFPSLVETVGLPLLEAQNFGAEIIAADRPYAREALEQYELAHFFDPESPRELAEAMSMHRVESRSRMAKAPQTGGGEDSWETFKSLVEHAGQSMTEPLHTDYGDQIHD